MNKFRLTLYVTGHTPRSEKGIRNLQRICAEELQGTYEMTVIDVLEQPQEAEDSNIMATPTLIKREPRPVLRLLGDLSATETVLRGLGIESTNAKKANNDD